MLTIRDTNNSFKLDGDLDTFKTKTKYNVDRSNTQDRKIIREQAEEMNSDIKITERPSAIDKSITKIFTSPAILASGISTLFVPADPD